MQHATLLHNPGAGDEEHAKEELISNIKSGGYNCRYFTTKENEWKSFNGETDFLVVAGGDGTVRKVVKRLIKKETDFKKHPLALLPLGTANNIARTLGISGSPEEIIRGWSNPVFKNFDAGRIEGLKKSDFIIEGLGFGVFPRLMKEMKNVEEADTPAEKLKTSLTLLRDIIRKTNPRDCRIELDGKDYSGRYLMVEVLNTCLIGPNLYLAPEADPGDGLFDVVMVPESRKDAFVAYISNKLRGIDDPFLFSSVRARNCVLEWKGTHLHVDDELMEMDKPAEISIKMDEARFRFLLPGNQPRR